MFIKLLTAMKYITNNLDLIFYEILLNSKKKFLIIFVNKVVYESVPNII